MDFAGRPGDFLVALQKRDEGIVEAPAARPRGQSDLHRGISSASGSPGRLEVDGGKCRFLDLDGGELAKEGLEGNPNHKEKVWAEKSGKVAFFLQI
jgi:hypothetical protein